MRNVNKSSQEVCRACGDENRNHGPLTHSHALLFIWIMSVFCIVEKISLVCRACRKETNDICRLQHKTALGFVSDGVSPGENPEDRREMCIIPPTMCNALLSYSRRLGTQTWHMRVRLTTQVKNMIMNTVTSLHDVGREEGWALLDDQKWKMVVVLNATVYGVMKRCLKKKRYTERRKTPVNKKTPDNCRGRQREHVRGVYRW